MLLVLNCLQLAFKNSINVSIDSEKISLLKMDNCIFLAESVLIFIDKRSMSVNKDKLHMNTCIKLISLETKT